MRNIRRRLKVWELALGIGLLAAVLAGAFLDRAEAELSDSLVRLHVVAQSDDPADQRVKLAVRDRVLAYLTPLLAETKTPDEAKNIIAQNLPEVEALSVQVLRENGFDLSARAGLEHAAFPTKTYNGFALPAGDYDALRVVIGEGRGQNWWCVVFPPLCMTAAEEVTQTAATGGLSDDQIGLITEDGDSYVFKFKCLEWWGQLKGFFGA
ncbi:MAG: stage II sporulation protein R [Oscillospiraceae bacterium]|jgi:stage II sporulation protein R|nr:stage II sporulation protein R [Oscillospiraceae bacterium]